MGRKGPSPWGSAHPRPALNTQRGPEQFLWWHGPRPCDSSQQAGRESAWNTGPGSDRKGLSCVLNPEQGRMAGSRDQKPGQTAVLSADMEAQGWPDPLQAAGRGVGATVGSAPGLTHLSEQPATPHPPEQGGPRGDEAVATSCPSRVMPSVSPAGRLLMFPSRRRGHHRQHMTIPHCISKCYTLEMTVPRL